MPTNDFLPFATGGGANVISQPDYAALPALPTGFQSGVAKSQQLNKVWRQSSIMAAVLAQFISDQTGQDALDDGTIATLLANLKQSMPGRLLRTTVYRRVGGVQQVSVNGGAFTSTGASTHTRHADAQTIIGEAQAAGGAGAGAGGAGSGNVSMGAPGGSGSYGKSIWTAAAFGASQAITVGAAGVAASNAAGGNGGSSSIGSLLTTPGGIGGGLFNNVLPPSQNGNGSFTTAPTGANMVSVRGGSTQASFGLGATNGIGGTGGNSMFGPGATGPGINTNGISALNHGTGGSGVVVNQSGGTAVGGDGADGIVIIQEFA